MMKKEAIMPIAVLTVICVVVAALLGAVNLLTRDKIAENALKKEQASLIEVMPGASTFDEVDIPTGAASTVKSVYREVGGRGYVFIMVAEKTDYSSGDMTISVGVSEGKITGAKLTSYNESKDLGKNTYPEKFVGKSEADYDNVEVTSGVTFSSKAFKAAIGDALACAALLDGESTVYLSFPEYSSPAPSEDNSLEASLKNLVPGAVLTEAALPVGADATLKDLWSVDKGGFVMHIVVPGAYVPVATEALVYVNASGVIEAIDLMQWVVGHDVGAGNFAEGFIGKNAYHIDETELVSGATGTSKDFKNAATAALNVATDLMNLREKLFNDLILELTGGSAVSEADIPDGTTDTLKKLWSVENGGYVMHVIVPGAYVPVATEALVYVNGVGEIESIKLMQWVVGHDVGAGNFAEGFIGKNIFSIGDVDIVSGATGTSADFKNAAISALSSISALMEEEIILHLVDKAAPFVTEFEKLTLPENAPSTLKALYSAKNGRGTVAHIVVPGAYVPVASNALVYFDQYGEIKNVTILEWVVGHGIDEGDFAERLVGATNETLEEVELVTNCTGTSGDLRAAIAEAYGFIPTESTAGRTAIQVGAGVIIILSLGGLIAYLIISRKRRTGK